MRSTTLLLLIIRKQWNLALSLRIVLIFVLAKSLLHEVGPPLDPTIVLFLLVKILQPTAIYIGNYTTDRANVEHSVKATKLSIQQRKSIEWYLSMH